MSKVPSKFVGLHSHSTFSTFDAIGRPQDHIDFALKNGMDALALTDHGNMNGFSHQYVHSEKLKKTGVKFKPIFGVEAYFVPSLTKWRELYEEARAKGTLKPIKKRAKAEADPENAGNEMASTEAELSQIADAKQANTGEAEEDDGGTIVENEEESKTNKYKNPIYQRNHLVLLAKNDAGLKSLFKIVSESAADGFYKYPRVDLDSLRRNCKGNVVASTACIAGYPSKIIFDHQKEEDHKLWLPNDDNIEIIQKDLEEAIAEFQEVLGKENYYLEIQFNKLGAQHLANYHILKAAKRTGCPVLVTVDAHYSDPNHWREREIYKMLGWQQKGMATENIPQKIDELKCELYPKNAEQVWDSYKKYCEGFDFYDDDFVREAIERTHSVAHEQIGQVQIDRKVKLPSITRIVEKDSLEKMAKDLGEGTDEDAMAFKELKRLAIEGLRWRKKATDQKYVERLKYELEVVKTLKFSKYFLTYHKIMEVVGSHMLIGNARGCFLPGTRVKMADGMLAPIESVQIGEKVIDADGKNQVVENTLEYDCKEDIVELEFDDGKVIRCTKDHKFLTTNRGWVEAKDLTDEDDIKEV